MQESSGSSPSRNVDQLAIHGGSPACPAGPPAWPQPNAAVEEALLDCYASGDWGRYHGQFCPRLVSRLQELLPGTQATLCSSGTVAVELALRGIPVGPGEEVLLAAYDFPGNFRAIESTGAAPVLVDVRLDDGQLDIEQVAAALGPKCKAVIASHLHGGLVDMPALRPLAAAHNLAIIEDACQCPGATVFDKLAGSWGDVAVWSFGGSKLLTAGRGGAVFTADPHMHQRIKIFQTRGNDAYPLSELQAAVLLPQLDTLSANHEQRSASVARLISTLETLPGLRLLKLPAGKHAPAYYKLGLFYEPAALGGLSRSDFVAAMQAEGVAVDEGFRGFALRSSRCRASSDLASARQVAQSMLVLHHPVLTADATILDQVAHAFAKVCRHYAT